MLFVRVGGTRMRIQRFACVQPTGHSFYVIFLKFGMYIDMAEVLQATIYLWDISKIWQVWPSYCFGNL